MCGKVRDFLYSCELHLRDPEYNSYQHLTNACTLFTIHSTPHDKKLDWIAVPTSKVLPMKSDAFLTLQGLGMLVLDHYELYFATDKTINLIEPNHIHNAGKGKFGIVFLAKQVGKDSLNLHVAIKYVPKQTIFDYQMASKIQQVSHTD